MIIHALPAFSDNVIWAIEHEDRLYWVDPGDAQAAAAVLRPGLQACAILLTHHHADHCGGVPELLARWPQLPVYGPADERLPWVSEVLQHDQRIEAGPGLSLRAIACPGHTRSHMSYLLRSAEDEQEHLFCGDTLFSAGCGRLFEGDASDLLLSLSRLRALPASCRVYPAHEYTAANLSFARALLPQDRAIADYTDFVTSRRKLDQYTLPSSIVLEKAVNVFLRWDDPLLIEALCDRHHGLARDPRSILGQLRRDKDVYVARDLD